jgi:hypothetical protein
MIFVRIGILVVAAFILLLVGLAAAELYADHQYDDVDFGEDDEGDEEQES